MKKNPTLKSVTANKAKAPVKLKDLTPKQNPKGGVLVKGADCDGINGTNHNETLVHDIGR